MTFSSCGSSPAYFQAAISISLPKIQYGCDEEGDRHGRVRLGSNTEFEASRCVTLRPVCHNLCPKKAIHYRSIVCSKVIFDAAQRSTLGLWFGLNLNLSKSYIVFVIGEHAEFLQFP